MPLVHALLLPTLALSLLGCFGKDTSDDDDDDDGGGGGGWDLGTSDDTGVHGDGGGGDGGGGDGGGGDGGGGDGGGGPDDEDGDGFTVADGDCDDRDEDVHPGAYDRPNDGVDQDCEDGDRSFDGLVLDPGQRTMVEFTVTLPEAAALDVGLVVDTTGSMSGLLEELDATVLGSLLEAEGMDTQIALATYADYSYSTYGESTDLPFRFQSGSTWDIASVQDLVEDLGADGGGDGPESGMEALYQALTGVGYDQDCDGRLDTTDDVPPFLASASDPFGGSAAESYDPGTVGIGTRGGLGFRDGAVPVLVYITDNYLRDDDVSSYGTPGGCPGDAGASEVLDAAADLDAWLIGVSVNGTLPRAQMNDLAEAAGSMVDDDGDGSVDDEAVIVWSGTTDLSEDVAEMIGFIAETGAFASRFDLVRARATTDSFGLVTGIAPATYTAVDASDTPTLDFTVTLTAPSSSSSKRQTTVEVEVQGDGEVLYTHEILVELAPG
ncbi:hypothetical protein L6R53_12030 [Myxococcota bacterium]|nr:hypothetical protein [Myxococcota bacterium]